MLIFLPFRDMLFLVFVKQVPARRLLGEQRLESKLGPRLWRLFPDPLPRDADNFEDRLWRLLVDNPHRTALSLLSTCNSCRLPAYHRYQSDRKLRDYKTISQGTASNKNGCIQASSC